MTNLILNNIELRFGGVHALSNVSLEVPANGIHALIGPNGAGKTSLLNIITGAYAPTAGSVSWQGKNITRIDPFRLAKLGIARTFQNLEIFWTMSVIENVMTACQALSPPGFFQSLIKPPSIIEQESSYKAQAERLLGEVDLLEDAELPSGDLPYGKLKRLEIARALALKPQLLLLDEPAAGCNPTETAQLAKCVRKVADEGTAIILIEHDMRFVMDVSDEVIVLDSGVVIAQGKPAEIQTNKKVIEAYLGVEDDEYGVI